MPPAYPGPAYQIVTQRLVIRCYNPEDAPMLKASIDESIEHLLPWMPWAAAEPQELQQKIDLARRFRGRFDLGEDFVYGIFNKEGTRQLGGTGLHTRVGSGAREIGYWVHPNFINQGFATETAAALTRVAFEIDDVNRVEIHCDPANTRSANVPRKLGYIHEATLRQRIALANGGWRDTMIWTLLKEDYQRSPCASTVLEAYDAIGRKII